MGVKGLSGQVRLTGKDQATRKQFTVLMRFSGGVTKTVFANLKADVRKLAKRSKLRLTKFQLKRAKGAKRAKKK